MLHSFLLLLGWVSLSHALTFEQIRAWVDQGEAKTLPQLLERLPEEMRRNFSFMKFSRSLQEGSAESPRVILIGDGGDIFATFNGRPEQRGYHDLELMFYREATHRYELRRIEFPEVGRPRVSPANPPACLKCHDDDPRPLWEPRPLYLDSLPEGISWSAPEIEELRRFLGANQTHARYGKLLAPIATAGEVSPSHLMHRRFNERNATRLSRLARESAQWETKKRGLLATLLDCPSITDGPEFKEWLRKIRDRLSSAPEAHVAELSDVEYRIVTGIQLWLESAGLDIRTWSRSIAQNYLLVTWAEDLYPRLVKDLKMKDASLSAFPIDDEALLRHLERARFPEKYEPAHQQAMTRSCEWLERHL